MTTPIATSNKGIATSNNCITTIEAELTFTVVELGAKGIATNGAIGRYERGSWHRYYGNKNATRKLRCPPAISTGFSIRSTPQPSDSAARAAAAAPAAQAAAPATRSLKADFGGGSAQWDVLSGDHFRLCLWVLDGFDIT